MTPKLPTNLENLLSQQQAEGECIEYETGGNPDAILRTMPPFMSPSMLGVCSRPWTARYPAPIRNAPR